MSLAKSWFDHTFSSRAVTERLLGPDVESGLLSQHDFDLAVSFLPGYHRYLPYLHTVLWGAVSGLYLYRFKPKARFPVAIVGGSSAAGYGVGLINYFHLHGHFARQLDDPQAFLLTLENVNQRIGNHTPLFPALDRQKTLRNVQKRKEAIEEVFTPDSVSVSPDSAEEDAPPSITITRAAPTKAESPPRHKSAWDAIREANAQSTGKPSSWDELRQRHERQRIAERTSVRQETSSALEDPRANAQAEFDAILEAERKAARG